MNSCLILIGGRSNVNDHMLPIEVYDTETCEWYKCSGINRYRQQSWIYEHYILSYGGF